MTGVYLQSNMGKNVTRPMEDLEPFLVTGITLKSSMVAGKRRGIEGVLMETKAPVKKYETPVIIDLGAVTRGQGAACRGGAAKGPPCGSGNRANTCNSGSRDVS